MIKDMNMKFTKTKRYEEINKISSSTKRLIFRIVSLPLVLVETMVDILKTNKVEKRNTYENELAFVAIVKNEASYIQEWIEYHRIIGVSKFYIYDNESTDNLKQVIQPYIDKGLVIYRYYPGKLRQLEAYKDAVQNYKFKNHYMAFVDIDEFLLLANKGQGCMVSEILNNIFNKQSNIGAVAINWRHFGSSYHKTRPEGLVIENYLYRAFDDFDRNFLVKTICNPRRVVYFLNPHYPILDKGFIIANENATKVDNQFCNENSCQILCLNHYFCKSVEEAKAKMLRGKISDNKKLDWGIFKERDRNEVYDESMLIYVNLIKDNMRKVNEI